MTTLRIDWATHKAVVYACEHWHYSRCVSLGKCVRVGVWEDGKFIGIVLFARGAARHLGRPYGLTQGEVCELTRVALREHATPVSRIVALAIKFLRRASPGMRLIVSFADEARGHFGGIYQAMNWIYTGVSLSSYFVVRGELMHPKSVETKYGRFTQRLDWIRENVDPDATRIAQAPKHRYLYPLDEEMRTKIQPLALPYPKAPTPDARDKRAMAGSTGTAAVRHRPSRSTPPML